MRITIVQGPFLPVPPILGGAVEKVWYSLGKEFSRKRHHVTHISRSFTGLATNELKNGVNYKRLKSFNATSYLYINIILDFIYAFKVYRILPQADILVSNSFSLPLLIRNNKYGRLYIHLARKPKGQLFLYRHASRIQTVSRSMKDEIIMQEPGLREKIKVIPNTISMKLNYDNLDDVLRFKEKKMLYVGRIHPEKGIEILIRAFGETIKVSEDWTLDIVGPWEINQGGGGLEYYSYLKKISEPSGHKIRFAGPVYNEIELNDYYKRAKLFIYPSIAEKGESFGLATLEAMSFGCVPIVSTLECFREFIDEGSSGYFFDYRTDNSAKYLSHILIRLTKNDLKEVLENAIEKSKHFSLDRISQLYLDDFAELLN